MKASSTTQHRTTSLQHRILGHFFRTGIRTFRILPCWLAYGLADLLVPFLVVATAWRKETSRRKRRGFHYNVAIVFRDALSGRDRRRLLWSWARHMTHFGVDVCKMPQITADNMSEFCDLSEMWKVRECFDRGKGILAATGHMGVYEFSSHLISLSGMPTTTVFRESPIPIVTDIINEIRGSGGQLMTERSGAIREVRRAIRRGDVAGLVADVSSKGSEVFAPFLGTDAATSNAPGVLHSKTGAPIMVITTQRTGRRRYKLHVWGQLDLQMSDDRNANLLAAAQFINKALTRAITEYPEQWFWDSRRFRTRRPDETLTQDGLPTQADPGPGEAILTKLHAQDERFEPGVRRAAR